MAKFSKALTWLSTNAPPTFYLKFQKFFENLTEYLIHVLFRQIRFLLVQHMYSTWLDRDDTRHWEEGSRQVQR